MGGCGEAGDAERRRRGHTADQAGPQKGGGGKVTGGAGRGEPGTAASPRGDGVALSVMILSGMADNGSRTWGIQEKKALSAPTADVGGVSSVLISQCSSSKSGAIWTQSCPSYKLSAAPRDCSGSQDLLAHPRASVLVARRADGTGSTTVALHHLVPPVRGSPAEPGEPGFGHCGVTQPNGVEPPRHIAMSRHLNTFEDTSCGANVQDGHVRFWLVVLCQASPKQQPEVGDKAGE